MRAYTFDGKNDNVIVEEDTISAVVAPLKNLCEDSCLVTLDVLLFQSLSGGRLVGNARIAVPTTLLSRMPVLHADEQGRTLMDMGTFSSIPKRYVVSYDYNIGESRCATFCCLPKALDPRLKFSRYASVEGLLG